MKYVKVAGVVVILAGLAAAAVAFAPEAQGQVVVRQRDADPPARYLEILGGRGSEIGVSVRDVDEADVKREKLPAPAGAVIEEVRSGSPAAKAGLRAGDVVVEFDGERVRSARQFARLVEETPAGRTVRAAVMRGGARAQVEITPDTGSRLAIGAIGPKIEERLRNFKFSLPDIQIPEFDIDVRPRFSRFGASVQTLSPQLADYFGVKEGVLVSSVTDGSVAAKAGLKAGDVITAVNDWRIDDADDLRRRLSRLEAGAEFTIAIVRDRKPMTLKGKFDESAAVRGRRVTRPI